MQAPSPHHTRAAIIGPAVGWVTVDVEVTSACANRRVQVGPSVSGVT